jgi:hypothetical protein
MLTRHKRRYGIVIWARYVHLRFSARNCGVEAQFTPRPYSVFGFDVNRSTHGPLAFASRKRQLR